MSNKIKTAIQENPNVCACTISGLLVFGLGATYAIVKLKKQLKESNDSLIRCKVKMNEFFNEWNNGSNRF